MAHRLSPEAEAELDEIWHYTAVESGSLEIADRLIDSLTRRLYLLAVHPHLGGRRDHDLAPDIRSFPVGGYLILYRPGLNLVDPNQREVLVLHIVRGSRDIQALFDRFNE